MKPGGFFDLTWPKKKRSDGQLKLKGKASDDTGGLHTLV
jgi:hypothetical protein